MAMERARARAAPRRPWDAADPRRQNRRGVIAFGQMRIPPSVIVMSALTAFPFGLAIRETLEKGDRLDEMKSSEERMRAEAAKRYEDESRDMAQRDADARATRMAEDGRFLASLFGVQRAQLGWLFG